ncbi:MAG: alkyl sulfatase dimerization domain-containing protein [Pseudomonadota bacterium]
MSELNDAARKAKPATEHTIAANAALRESLPFEDRTSFANAKRGFIATLDPLTIARDGGRRPAYDLSALAFLDDECPDTVKPSLWRQAQLNALYTGLYEVTDGIYQVRSFDIANMTLIRGETGWIIIDPLTSSESSAAALKLANEHLGERPVVAVIHTHSHADHFAGVLGVVTAEDAASGKVAVIAPAHFVDEALSENVLAGNAMGRRATYMYGNLLEPSATGFVSTGLGAALSMGTTGFVVPNDIVAETGETRTIDGVEFDFQMTPGTEAPAEFVFYLPQFKALCMSEITSHHLHNVYTLRGAQVRDALAWSEQINESIERYGDDLEIHFACHHWPIWGREPALEYLRSQRDLYKYLHDQVLRLANQGFNPEEIAEQLTLPDSLDKNFSNRGYYGSVHHNAKAVYVKYLGFFDGNPANIARHPPAAAGSRYVDFMGGADAVVEKAEVSFAAGDYRWVAEVLNHVIMSDPEHSAARMLLADALEQLGYQAESAVWRNFYLTGALELRHPVTTESTYAPSAGTALGIPLSNIFKAMAVRLNGHRAAEHPLAINLKFTDLAEPWLLSIENGVLRGIEDASHPDAAATLTMTSTDFKGLMVGLSDGATLLNEGRLVIEGDAAALLTLTGLFDQFPRRYPIVTPRQMP